MSQVGYLNEFGLSERWLLVFEDQLHIRGPLAMKYIGIESYPLLVQHAKEPREKKALQRFLQKNNKLMAYHIMRDKQIKDLFEKQIEIKKILGKLENSNDLESHCREILGMPESAWFEKDANVSFVCVKVERMLKNIETSSELKDLDDATFLAQAQGSLSLENIGGLALKGFFVMDELNNIFVRSQDLLKPPNSIELQVPLCSQYFERRYFKSKEEEEYFFQDITKFGYSLPVSVPTAGNIIGSKTTEAYCSTVQYFCFPLASCYFSDHQLLLSSSALSHLKLIDQAISQRNMESVVEDECKKFFHNFGSHSLRGPFHFGGIYICKCFSSNYNELETFEEITEFHNNVIDAQMSMSFDPCYETTCLVEIEQLPGKEKLKQHTFVEIITSGGPKIATGLPDWKNGLVGSNKMWKLIDCGTTLAPVWETILVNHRQDFKNPEHVAMKMKEFWKSQKGVLCHQLNDQFKIFCKNLDMEPPIEHKLHLILAQRRDIEQKLLDPQAWAAEFLLYLEDYLCSIVERCNDVELDHIRSILQDIVHPLDLGVRNIFSSLKDGIKRVFKTSEMVPALHLNDFIHICRYFKLALRIFSSDVMHPYFMLKRTLLVEKAVQCLRSHLKRTDQTLEECLLVTILHPLEYNPHSGRFRWLLTKLDIVYLSTNFADFSHKYFMLDQRNRANMCSYLFYLSVCVSHLMDTAEECTKSHMQFLQKQLKPYIKDFPTTTIANGPNFIDCMYEETMRTFMLLRMLGLHGYFPQTLTIQDAIQIRDDTLKFSQNPTAHIHHQNILEKDQSPSISVEPHKATQLGYKGCRIQENLHLSMPEGRQPFSDPSLPVFAMLQSIFSFAPKFNLKSFKSTCVSESDDSGSEDKSDSENEEDEDDCIHPTDYLVSLLHCSDNFLRQDIFCRLASCQMAVPLVLPDPILGQPTLLLWALRSIVKDFKTNAKDTFSGQIITYPTPFVSFLRLGEHKVSKSEILNGVMNKIDSETKAKNFFCYNSPGGTANRIMNTGLVEISWYLPGDGLFPKAIAFTNLRGNASHAKLQKQVQFLCDISTLHVVFLSDCMFEDATRTFTIDLLKKLSQAPGGVILAQTKTCKGFRELVSQYFKADYFKKKFSIVNHHKSITQFVERLQLKLKSKLPMESRPVFLNRAAEEHCIFVDEDSDACVKGRKVAEDMYAIIEDFKVNNPQRSCKSLLPLQSEHLWHKWAELDKEQYRQKQKCEYEMQEECAENGEVLEQRSLTAMEYGKNLRERMKEIRNKQYPIATNLNKLMSLFVQTLQIQERHRLKYCLMWLQFKLDDFSKKILPPISCLIREKRNELSGYQTKQDELAVQKCKDDLKILDKKLLNASFGLEHFFREVGQIYEAVTTKEMQNNDCRVRNLPRIAAQLLHDGFPLELLDGDASHLPQNWISSVLSSLADILREINGDDPSIYVLSVLGIQSSGKSTLLNTVFGVKFSVSVGRCTRGAFMQLIPVHSSLHEKIGVKYFLLIDTEGLRAPELNRLEAREHDNELATFVIGMANLTLLNVSGELAGDIDDILHTSVHAFLRMSQVQLKPCCHIIHQHVSDVAAEDKLIQVRFKTKDNLDKMTQAAAKETGTRTLYTQFTDVIKFDHETDVSFFPGLWSGNLPMARVSSGYSEGAQRLKLDIIAKCTVMSKYQSNALENLQIHLKKLWNAILQEDFVFTFQNTFEILAYNTLESKYGDWSWYFTNDVVEWERKAENALCGCSPIDIDDVFANSIRDLEEFSKEKHLKYKNLMNNYFKENRDIILKWKPDMEHRLQHLCRKLVIHAEKHCEVVYKAQRDRAIAENTKGRLSMLILEEVHKLVSILGQSKITEHELKAKFNEKWGEWIKNIRMEPLKPPDIAREVETCISNHYHAQKKFVTAKLAYPDHGKPLREWGTNLELFVEERHIQILQRRVWGTNLINFIMPSRKPSDCIQKAQMHSSTTFVLVEKLLIRFKSSGDNFSPQLAIDLLRLIKERRKMESDEFQFTDEYEVDMALTACGNALQVFKEMAERFRRKYDPTEYVNCEMKPHFQKIFINLFKKVDKEKIAAESLCHQLKEPIEAFVLESLPVKVVKEIKGAYSWIGSKTSFVGKILLEIGEWDKKKHDKGFFLCMQFITDFRLSLCWWAENFTKEYCEDGSPSRLSEMAIDMLNETVSLLISKAKDVTQSQKEQFSAEEWLKCFHSKALAGNLKISLDQLQIYIKDQPFSDANFFTEELVKGLALLQAELQECFSKIRYVNIIKEKAAHDYIFEKVAGCTEQCPFCKAECQLTTENHPTTIKHSAQHRPQCLGGVFWRLDDRMVLEACPSLVASDLKFGYKTSGGKLSPFKSYRDFHPNWAIPADKSVEVPMFWKWFLARHSDDVKEYFGLKSTQIPNEWENLKWETVKDWIVKEYHL